MQSKAYKNYTLYRAPPPKTVGLENKDCFIILSNKIFQIRLGVFSKKYGIVDASSSVLNFIQITDIFVIDEDK